MDLTSIAKVIDWHKNETDSHSGGGIFITLPSSLAKKYPEDGREGHDTSPPHITVLYIDNVKNLQDKKGKYLQAIEKVCKNIKPFKIKLGKTDKLVNDKNETVYYSSISCGSLEKLNKKIRNYLEKEKLTFSKRYKKFKPHVTIEYVEEGNQSKYENKQIKGEWEVNYIWLFGFGSPSIIFLGG